jgi:Tetratricopeptide repeat
VAADKGGGSQRVVGSGNVQVQNVHNSQIQITVTGGAPQKLPLQAAVIPVGQAVRSPTRLLRARSGVIPYTARRRLLDELEQWCREGEPFGVRVIAGGGGTGKTRLAAELCSVMDGEGWLSGLYVALDGGGGVEALARVPAPRLVVVDYAETRPEQLAVVLPFLAAEATVESPVRVVLLVRTAPPSRPGDFLGVFDGYGEALAAIGDLARLDVLTDAPLTVEERHELFGAAVERLAERLDPDVDGLPSQGEERLDLEASVFGNPLLVVIAAYLAAVGRDRAPASRAELLDVLIEREANYWRQSAAAHTAVGDDALRRRVVALTTLAGPSDEAEAAELLRLIPDLADATEERRRGLARWADALYGGGSQWRPVEPDLVGEHLVATTWQDHPGVIAGALTRADPARLVHTLDLLTRAAIDYAALAATTTAVLRPRLPDYCAMAIAQASSLANDLDALLSDATLAGALNRAVESFPPDPATLPAIVDALPESNLVLDPLALTLAQTLLTETRRLVGTDETTYLPDLASSLNHVSVRLGALGRRQDGLAAIEEAVTIHRRLAETNPATYLPDLAYSLKNLSVRLGALGRGDEGLAAIEEAVTIDRRLAEISPATYLPDLARSLNNLSNRLGALGRREEGLAAIEEAVTIRRRLAEISAATYLPDLARSLNNLSNRLGALGRREEGLAAIEEAVTIRRRLAEINPAAHLPGLARSLNNLSNRLGEQGRSEEGLAAIEQALTIRRRLAETNPAAHLPDLATSLNNLSTRLGEQGRSEEGLAAIEQALTIRRRLAEINPAAHLLDLARSLNNLSNLLGELERSEDGLAAIEEAVSIRRRLAKTNPAAHLPGLARSLNDLSTRLGELGRSEDGLAASVEALTIRRRLAEINPATHLPGLARSLNNLSTRLGELGRSEEGLAAIEEAVSIRRRLAEINPAAHLSDLARSLNDLSNLLGELGRSEEGLAAIEEAVSIRRRLAEINPAAHLSDLARSLNDLSNLLGELGRSEEGLAAIEEAVSIRRRLAEINPAAHLSDLARSLNDLSNLLGELGRSEEGLAAIEEAVSIRRRLAEINPAAHLPNPASSLSDLSRVLGDLEPNN